MQQLDDAEFKLCGDLGKPLVSAWVVKVYEQQHFWKYWDFQSAMFGSVCSITHKLTVSRRCWSFDCAGHMRN